MRYFINRDNPLIDTKLQDIEKAFTTIVEYFDETWLNTKGGNPLQILWNRSDFLSTIELTTFGIGLSKLEEIDESWLKHQIRLIKSNNQSNQKGAFWEIIASYYLMDNNVEVRPTKINQAGFDVKVKYRQTNKAINYSLKYFSFSDNYQLFIKNCEEIHLLIYSALKTLKINNVSVFIRKNVEYPTLQDWENLKYLVVKGFEKYKNKTISSNFEQWEIIISYLPKNRYSLHKSYTSYILCIFSPYHKNEYANFISKIEDSIGSLKKYKLYEDNNLINSLFLHLPRTASMKKCDEWLLEYFKQIHENPIPLIILYQPSVNFLYKIKKTYIQHCVHITQNPNFVKWQENDIRNKFNLWFLTGEICANPHSEKLLVNDRLIDIDDSYYYQYGDLYINPYKISEGATYEKLEKLASGIQTHIVTKKSDSKFIIFEDTPKTKYKFCEDGKLKAINEITPTANSKNVDVKTDGDNYIITKPYEPEDELLIL